MPSWKKLIVSGSDASLNSLTVNSYISSSNFVGQFTGSFKGDGSQLTGITATIADQTSFTQEFTNVTSSLVTHNLNVDYPLVQIYGSDSEQLIPKTVKVLDSNSVEVSFETNESGHIVVAKGGHIVSINAPNANTLNNQSGSYYLNWNNFTNVPANLVSSSAQIAVEISGAFVSTSSSIANNITSISSSLASDITGLDSRLDTLEGKTLLSSSAQIALEISGAFTSTSSSLAFDITGLDSRLDTLEGKTLVSSSVQIVLQDTSGNLSGSRIVGDVPSATSSSYAGNAELLDGQDSSVFATTGSNTFTGTQTFNNIQVNGTGSFNYIQSITGSAKIIGDAYIILNNNVPAEPFAGLKIIDTGSTDVTASFLWDGVNNHWIYENVSGSTYGAAGFMGGPRSTDINNILYPTQYRVLRSQGGDHLYDSNITDNDTNVSISIPLSVTGDITSSAKIKANTGFIGNLTGNADTSTTSSYVEYSNVGNKPTLLSSSAQIAVEISGAFTSTSSSLALDITGLDSRLDTLEGKTLLSSSAQIAVEISGAFTQTSASLALEVSQSDARLDILEGKTLVSSSSQISYSGLTGIPAGIVSSSIQVDHNSTTNYVSNQHIDHSTVSVSAGDGLLGGGDITLSRTLSLDTGSSHFTGGVKSKLDLDGVVSGSSQVSFSGLSGVPSGLVSSSNQIQEYMVMAISDEITPLTVGEGKLTFRAPFTMNLYQIPRASLTSGSTSGNVVVDINSGSVSILGENKLSIDANEKTSTTATTPTTLANTVLTDDAEIRIDIDSAGTSATGLKVILYYTKG